MENALFMFRVAANRIRLFARVCIVFADGIYMSLDLEFVDICSLDRADL